MNFMHRFEEIRNAYLCVCVTSQLGREKIIKISEEVASLLDEPNNIHTFCSDFFNTEEGQLLLSRTFFLLLFSHLEECMNALYKENKEKFVRCGNEKLHINGFSSFKPFIEWLYIRKVKVDDFNDWSVFNLIKDFALIRNHFLHTGGDLNHCKNIKNKTEIRKIINKYNQIAYNGSGQPVEYFLIENSKTDINQRGMDLFFHNCMMFMEKLT